MSDESLPTLAGRTRMTFGSAVVLFVEFVLVFSLFGLYSSSPPPDVNEAHYLAKAKHYWNPDWCPNDQFLNSSDAHATFYWVFGWLTLYFPLPTVAWIGRGCVCFVLAAGWLSMSRGLCTAPLASVLSAGIYAALTEYGHMSGEWVLGGVEAKGFAYGFALIAFGLAIRGHWRSPWILLGVSSAFHVLVGGWSVIALGVAWLLWRDASKPSLIQMLPSLVGGGIISLAGLLPGIMLTAGAEPESIALGENVYVFQRLSHHLLVSRFPREFITRHALIVLSSLLAFFLLRDNRRYRLVVGIVVGAALIAIVGAVIEATFRGNEQLSAKLLKLYWYRVSDAYAPLGLALAAPLLIRSVSVRNQLPVAIVCAAMLLVTLGYEAYPRLIGAYPRADSQSGLVKATGYQKRYDDWLDVCQWASENTPVDAVFVTPDRQQTFKWYSGRAELVTWKDVPQDATSIREWLSRRDAQAKLQLRSGDDPDYARRLAKLAEKYGVTHFLFEWRRTPQPADGYRYHNGTFAIYAIPPAK